MKNLDASAFHRFDINGRISCSRRSNELQIRQTIQQRSRHRGPLPHDAENIKGKQTSNERLQLGDMVLKYRDLRIPGNRRPISRLQGYLLIVVQYRYFHMHLLPLATEDLRSANHRVVHGNPSERLAVGPHSAQTRKLNVRRCDDVAALRCISESALALNRRSLRVAVELDADRRVVELDARDVNQVAPNHELLPLIVDHIRAVTRSVTARRQSLDARAQLGFSVERREAIGLDVRVQRSHRALEELLRRVRSFLKA